MTIENDVELVRRLLTLRDAGYDVARIFDWEALGRMLKDYDRLKADTLDKPVTSSYGDVWKQRAERYEAALAEAEARLPEGMKHCTIEYKQCAVGHGRLIATNWIDHGCLQCVLAGAERERDRNSAQIAELQEELHHLYGVEQRGVKQ